MIQVNVSTNFGKIVEKGAAVLDGFGIFGLIATSFRYFVR